MSVRVEVREAPFEPWDELQRHEAALAAAGRYGATAVFVGTMRDFNDEAGVTAMRLEHYPRMTERHLERICDAARERWSLLDVLLIHRVGEMTPGTPIVLVAVWSAHRKDAFEASRFIMEDLKAKAPFWKQETLADGSSRWVEHNTPGF